MAIGIVPVFAGTDTEMRMYIYQNDGEEDTWSVAVNEVNSVNFDVVEEYGENADYMRVYDKKDAAIIWNAATARVDSILFQKSVIEASVKKENGAICYPYKVSDNVSVYFSQGNLWYNAGDGKTHATNDGKTAKGTWSFAENQYDFVGEGNAKISSSYNGWIDLFGWGTSGWNSSANVYQPWATSAVSLDYLPGGAAANNLTDANGNADWGVYNAISNGGNVPGLWRTLTSAEWQYLIANNNWTFGKIGEKGVLCFMLLPDNFTAPADIPVQILSAKQTDAEIRIALASDFKNTFTEKQFARLEKMGVVALPSGGLRGNTEYIPYTDGDDYWSATAIDRNSSYGFSFNGTALVSSTTNLGRTMGRHVRLVRNVN